MEKLKEYIKLQIDEVSEIIMQRAIIYAKNDTISTEEMVDIFDVDTDSELVSCYDKEDIENHNFDLGRIYTLKEIGDFINEHF